MIQLDDSGFGFDINSCNVLGDNDFFGCGIELIEFLCDSVIYSQNGIWVEVIYCIDDQLVVSLVIFVDMLKGFYLFIF